MNIVSNSIPSSWAWLLWLASALLGGVILRRAHWSMLADRRNLNIFSARPWPSWRFG